MLQIFSNYKNSFSFIKNDGYSLLLCILNCALLVHCRDIASKNLLIQGGIFILIILQVINYKNWWASLFFIFPMLCISILKYPFIANHSSIQMVIGIIICILLLLKLLKVDQKIITINNMNQIFCYTTVIIYFFTGFHKLNTDFFNIDISCVNVIGQKGYIVSSHTAFGRAFIRVNQVLTIFVELIMPFGLLFRKTRKVTVYVFILFHVFLSLCGFADFSSFALFLLLGCIVNFKEIKIGKVEILYLRFYQAMCLVSVLVYSLLIRLKVFEIKSDYSFVNGVIYNIGVVVFFYFIMVKRIPDFSYTKRQTIFQWLSVIVVFLWSIQSYVGLSTEGGLTMFSNLVTEKSKSNHLLVNTKYTKIWDFEEDNLRVLSLKVNGIELDDLDYVYPLITFKYNISKLIDYNIQCSIFYKGKVIEINDLKTSEFSKSKWWYRYMYFRRIPVHLPNPCVW